MLEPPRPSDHTGGAQRVPHERLDAEAVAKVTPTRLGAAMTSGNQLSAIATGRSVPVGHLRDSTIAPDEAGLLGSATVVDGRTGRKRNNALTLTFRSSPAETIAVGAQVGSAGVLFGFKNTGDAGRFTLKGPAGDLALDCRPERTTVTTAGGDPVGTVERVEDDGELRDAGGSVLARLAGLPKPRSTDE